MEKYNNFIKRVELLDVTLQSVQCEKVKTLEQSTGNVEVEVEPDFRLEEICNGVLRVFAIFNVRCLDRIGEQSDISESEVLRINAIFELIYDIENYKEEEDQEVIDLFIRRNVPVNIWPYGREIISSLTTRMGFPALIIGTFKTM